MTNFFGVFQIILFVMLDADFELHRDEFRNIWMNFQTVINLFFTLELVSDIYLQGL